MQDGKSLLLGLFCFFCCLYFEYLMCNSVLNCKLLSDQVQQTVPCASCSIVGILTWLFYHSDDVIPSVKRVEILQVFLLFVFLHLVIKLTL